MRCILLAATLLAASCYRPTGPAALDETLRVSIVADQARLVRGQAELHQAATHAVVQRLGWDCGPQGSARLDLVLAHERIDTAAHDSRGLPTRWLVELRGTALFVSRHGSATTTFVGTGYSSSTGDEPEALRAAAASAGDNIAVWLETQAAAWRPAGAKP